MSRITKLYFNYAVITKVILQLKQSDVRYFVAFENMIIILDTCLTKCISIYRTVVPYIKSATFVLS